MDSREVGRYGTVHYMKRLLPDTPVVAFPVDDEQVTFGRDPSCNVRLYYPQVSPLHCKVIIEERKAFLCVHGTNGVLIDGCHVYPTSSTPTIVPLPNYSEFEIHSKRFRFTYPPKELRAALLATPARCDIPKRALRLSMIQSAVVFSPRPSPDPQENLRVLQSPLKPYRTNPVASQDEVILVQGNHPRVVEEEKDLVICEDVDVESVQEPSTPPRFPLASNHSAGSQTQPPPQTPRNRQPLTLHRAVLIRSAQRAVLRAEFEREDEAEEQEVLQFISDPLEEEDENEEQEELVVDEDDDMIIEEQEDERLLAPADSSPQAAVPSQTMMRDWKKSLGVVQSSSPLKTVPSTETEEFQDAEGDNQIMDSNACFAQCLAGFSTPQIARREPASTTRRYSTGPVGELRKIKIEPVWRVKDIILEDVNEAEHEPEVNASNQQTPRPKESLSDAQRQAIRERRKSALTTPNAFFAGRVPGTPRASAVLGSTSPRKAVGMVALEEEPSSPRPIEQFDSTSRTAGHTEVTEDTELLLSKMKVRIEDAKRRKSDALLAHGRPSMGSDISPDKRSNLSGARPRFSLLPRIQDDIVPEPMEDSKRSNEGGVPAVLESQENHIGLSTPKMTGIREMFAQASRAPSTPVFTGIREMFHQPAVLSTPVYEGLQQMMEEPDPWPIQPGDEIIGIEEVPDHTKAIPPESGLKGPLRRVPLTRGAGKLARIQSKETPSWADDEATPQNLNHRSEEAEPKKPEAPKSRVRLLRGSKQSKEATLKMDRNNGASAIPHRNAAEEMDDVQSAEDIPQAAAKRGRRVISPALTSEQSSDTDVGASRRRGRIPKAPARHPPTTKPSTRKVQAAVKKEVPVPVIPSGNGCKEALDIDEETVEEDNPKTTQAPKRTTSKLPTLRAKAGSSTVGSKDSTAQNKLKAPVAAKTRARTTTTKKAVTLSSESTATSDDTVDKENAQEEEVATKPAPKARKTKKAAGTDLKDVVTEPEPAATGIRRSTRTRTKTG